MMLTFTSPAVVLSLLAKTKYVLSGLPNDIEVISFSSPGFSSVATGGAGAPGRIEV